MRHAPSRTASATSRALRGSTPGSSTSTTRSTRATPTSTPRSTAASATTSSGSSSSTLDEAHQLQKDYYRRYGTTLRGLIVEHGIAPDDFLDYVHDIDHSPVEADPRAGRGDRTAAGPEVHPHQRLAAARREGRRAARRHPPFRRHLRHRPLRAPAEAEPRDLRPLHRGDRRRAGRGRHVRGSGAQPRRAASPRHDDGAGRAGSGSAK